MPEQRVASPDFYDHGESMTSTQFRQACEHVERILSAADESELMSFGPSIVSREEATEGGWLDSPKEFKPMLRFAEVPSLTVELNGTEYTSTMLFFRRGGNDAAAKEWLGDLTFTGETGRLVYKFGTDGRIQLSKYDSEDLWINFCWVHESEADELNQALEQVKKHLHTKKTGELALA